MIIPQLCPLSVCGDDIEAPLDHADAAEEWEFDTRLLVRGDVRLIIGLPGPAATDAAPPDPGLQSTRAGRGEPLPYIDSGPVFLGGDVARYGSDNTAICIRYGDTVISIETYPKQSAMETAGRIAAAALPPR